MCKMLPVLGSCDPRIVLSSCNNNTTAWRDIVVLVVGKSANGIHSLVALKYTASSAILLSNLLSERARCSYFFDPVLEYDCISLEKVSCFSCNAHLNVTYLVQDLHFQLRTQLSPKKEKGKTRAIINPTFQR